MPAHKYKQRGVKLCGGPTYIRQIMPKRMKETKLVTPPRRNKPADSISTSNSSRTNLSRTQPRKRVSVVYPSLEERRAEVKHLLEAKHHSGVVLFRQEEMGSIREFVEKCRGGEKGLKFMMVTGLPGLGKTLTITTTLRQSGVLVIAINAIQAESLQKVQDIIYERLICRPPPKNLTTQKLANSIRGTKGPPAVVYVEEMDTAMKRPTNDYSSEFFELFADESLHLGLIGVSNSLDFLQRYCKRGEHHILSAVSNLKFSQYTERQIETLLLERLTALGGIWSGNRMGGRCAQLRPQPCGASHGWRHAPRR